MSATEVQSTSTSPAAAPQADYSFVSFDGTVRAEGRLQRPDRYRYWRGDLSAGPRISRGAGLSYSAASFGADGLSVEHRSFDRILDFDAARGLVEVEPGISLAALHRFLAPRGLHLPIQPGHGSISVGGCIGADVHGKNQSRDGTFVNQVESLTLLHPAHGKVELSPEREPELFRLTCGGYGLTGHILRARLRAAPALTNWVEVKATPFTDAGEGLARLRHSTSDADYAYTWHDMASPETGFGSGFLFEARFVPQQAQVPAAPSPNLSAAGRARWPVGLLNRFTARGLNMVFRRQQCCALNGKRVSLQDALFPTEKAQLYFKLFGAKGFREYQAIIPEPAIGDYLDSIRGYARKNPVPITLASAKAFAGVHDLLRFTGAGICFAVNMPAGAEADGFMAFLDARVMALGGTPNIIKDSRLPRAVVDACYPEADRFRSALKAFDPQRLFRSGLSERLGL